MKKTELIKIAKNIFGTVLIQSKEYFEIDGDELEAFAQEIRNRTIDECKNEAIAQYKTNSQYNGRYIAECIENLKEFNSAKELSDYLKSEVSK